MKDFEKASIKRGGKKQLRRMKYDYEPRIKTKRRHDKYSLDFDESNRYDDEY